MQLPLPPKSKKIEDEPTIEDFFIDDNEIFNNDDLKEDDQKFIEEILKKINFSGIRNFNYNENNKIKSETKIEPDLTFEDILITDVEMSEYKIDEDNKKN